MRSGFVKIAVLAGISGLLLAGCFNNNRGSRQFALSSAGSPLLNDPSPTPSPSPSDPPALASCLEGQSINLATSDIISTLSGGTLTSGTLVSLTPVVPQEMVAVPLSQYTWRITCTSQIKHWFDNLSGNRFSVAVNSQYRSPSGQLFSGTSSLTVIRQNAAPIWPPAGAVTYSITADGTHRIQYLSGMTPVILAPILPGPDGSFGANASDLRFYAVAKTDDNSALYAIGNAPQGSALYRVRPDNGELLLLELSTMPPQIAQSLSFTSATGLQLVTTITTYNGTLPAAPRVGRGDYVSPVDDLPPP